MSLGVGQLGPTSLAALRETHRKCSNSRVDLEELEAWLLGPGAGISTFCLFFPIPHKFLPDPHKMLADDWWKEREWKFVLVRSSETVLEEGCDVGRWDVLSCRSKAEEGAAQEALGWGKGRRQYKYLEMIITAVTVHSLGKERGENEEKL